MGATGTIGGGCHCGAIRYVAEGAYEHRALCHCPDCRMCAGAPMVGRIAFRQEQLTVTRTPVRHDSSGPATREFRGRCGTGLVHRNATVLPGILDVQSATLDTAADHPPGAPIMAKERLPWMEQVDTLPAFAGFPRAD